MAESDPTSNKLDRILTGLGNLVVRLDAIEVKAKEKDDKASKADADFTAQFDALMKKVDACTERMDAMDMARRDELINPSPERVTTADSAGFINAQVAAERVAQAFGDSAGAPRWLQGEKLIDYQRRLMLPYQRFSAAWKDIPVVAIDDQVIDVAETQIYADAIAAASSPSVIGAGNLRESVETDRTGRKITRFTGDPEACWAAFKGPRLNVVGFDTPKTRH